ncbi:MAG: S8 family serine peptidase [Gaiellaceae bacterium]
MLRGVTSGRRLALLCALAVALAALAVASPPVAGGLLHAPPPAADRDGDGVFDDLEARLTRAGVAERVPVIVRLVRPATRARVAALEDGVGDFPPVQRFSIVPAFATRLTRAQVETLARDPAVTRVEADAVVHGVNDKAQAAFGVSKARLDLPWLDGDRDGNPASFSNSDVVVAVVDSGIDTTHPDLPPGKVIDWHDSVTKPGALAPFDDNGHGTHVAGILAGTGQANALYRGVAPGAAIVAVKVLDKNQKGSSSDVIAGIEWVEKNIDADSIDIVNLSLQAGSPCAGKDSLTDAVNRIAARGVLVTVAAGNSGPGFCTIGSPALAAGALTVGAMADTGEGGFRLASFSSRGPTYDNRVKPDLVAPGVNIKSTCMPPAGPCIPTDPYSVRSGTSMAAPFAAGVGALMLDANVGLTGQQLKGLLMATALDWGRGADNADPTSRGADVDYGAGRLDAYAAIAAAGVPLASPPPVPGHDLRHGSLPGAGAQADHRLVVTGTDFPLAITAIAPGGTGLDVDLSLFDPAGSEVANAAGAGRQADLSITPAVTGAYTLRVKSAAGAGGYFVDISGIVTSPPANDGAPSISGEPREGQALTTSAGRWSGGTPMTYAFQWVRCDTAGGACAGIAGATGTTYTTTVADIGATLRVVVTATNAAGSVSATTSPTLAIAALPPANTAAPLVSGRTEVGHTLQAQSGEWRSALPLAYAFQWRRCNRAVTACNDIPGATQTAYVLRPADAGSRVGVAVIATNGGGSTEAVSAAPLVEALAPHPTARPRISGRPLVGRRFRATAGRWLATPPLRFTWRWSRCNRRGERCIPLPAHGRTYLLRRADAGRTMRVRVFADNRPLAGGARTSIASRATRVVRR